MCWRAKRRAWRTQQPETADFTQNVLRRAHSRNRRLLSGVSDLCRYRGRAHRRGPARLDWAMKQARANETDIDPSVFDFLGTLLSGDLVAQRAAGSAGTPCCDAP